MKLHLKVSTTMFICVQYFYVHVFVKFWCAGKARLFELSTIHNIMPEHIYDPITAIKFSAMFTFQLDNAKR